MSLPSICHANTTYVWLRTDPWTSRVKQMVSVMSLVVPLSLVVSTTDEISITCITKLRTRFTVEASEFIWGFLFVNNELTTCEFTLKPVTALSEDQLRGWVPVVLVPPSTSGVL